MAKKAVPVIDEKAPYDRETENNELVFKNLVKNLRPDIWVLMDVLDTTGVNYFVVFKIIRALNNIATGNKWGKVSIEIENGVATFVRGEESDRVSEDVILKKKPGLNI